MSFADPLVRAKLLILRGNISEQVELKGSHTYIGRGRDNDVPLSKDTYLSRRHSLIARLGDQFFLCDLGSRNGTLLNGKLVVGVMQLHVNDEIFIGTTKLVFTHHKATYADRMHHPVTFEALLPPKGAIFTHV